MWTSQYAGRFAALRLARGTRVLDFFAMLLRHRRHRLILQVNEQRRHFQSLLQTRDDAFAAAVAFPSVDNDVKLARTVTVAIMRDDKPSTL